MIVILQARLTSTRLPAKVLLDLDGKPVIRWLIDALGRTPFPRVIAIPDTPANDPLAEYCKDLIPVYRGAEQDVLSRYYHAAEASGDKEGIVRVTGDCPLLTPGIIIDCVAEYQQNTNNYVYSSWGDGFDCEVFSYTALDVAYHLTTPERTCACHTPPLSWEREREHVTPFMKVHYQGIKVGTPRPCPKLSIDTLDDYLFVSRVARRLRERHHCVREIQEIAQDEANRKPVGE